MRDSASKLQKRVEALTRELKEARAEQAATALVLRVIASSPTDIQPVLETVVASAAKLCDSYDAVLLLRNGETLEVCAHFGPIPVDFSALPITREWAVGKSVLDCRTVHIPDVSAPDHEFVAGRASAKRQGFRTALAVPLVKRGEAIGTLTLRRIEVRPFTDEQIDLINNFASQAVIAIENVRLFEQVEARTAELTEALNQQTATADVLKVISRSAFDLQPVLDALVESAARVCEADNCVIFRRDGEFFRFAANYGFSREFEEYGRTHPHQPGRGSVTGRAAAEGRTIHIPDVLADPDYGATGYQHLGGYRTALGVPLLREGVPIGAFALSRADVRPFTKRQIELVETFADQAVIAIENVRLFTELGEALAQQTATADVLKVISRSTFDLQTVLDTLVESAVRVCEAEKGAISQRRGDVYHFAASFGFSPEYKQHALENPLRAGQGSITGRVALEGKSIHITDVLADEVLADPASETLGYHRLGGHRTTLGVPLLREGLPVGVFVLTRTVVKPFTGRQIEMVETFADQAVIAIENARLFEAVQARTRDLSEALQQQTATADVLKVISRSTFDLRTVLDTLTESAARLCEADMAAITRLHDDGQGFYYATSYNFPPDWLDYVGSMRLAPGRDSVVGRVLLEHTVVQVDDVLADPGYDYKEQARKAGLRTYVGVPMMREGSPIGVLTLGRATVRPFNKRQIEIIQSFADQAVIAIENVRLFEQVQARTAELSEALRQQTATADVLKVISRSAFDLQAMLDSLVESAVRVCEAENGVIAQRREDLYYMTANHGFSRDYEEYARAHPVSVDTGSTTGRVVLGGKTVHIADVLADPDYQLLGHQEKGHYRTQLGVPLLSKGEPVGVFVLTRPEVKPFTAKQIELVEIFADQAVIAIENVRLFNEVQLRTAELSEALQQQTETADVMKVISRSAFDLQVVLDTLVESATRACEAAKGVILQRRGELYHLAASRGLSPEFQDYARAHPLSVNTGSTTGRAALSGKTVHIADVLADPDYDALGHQELGDYRTSLGVPLLSKGIPVGVFVLMRPEVKPFTARQIELVETFADQAVIAIENVRLFDEVQARTLELARSLEGLRTAQDRLIQTEKLASLGQLTAGIAHEIKNPLNFVNNFSAISGDLVGELDQILKETALPTSTRVQVEEVMSTLCTNLAKVEQHGKRADSIVKNMLLHSRQGSGEHRPTSINAIVEESLNLAYHGARAEKQGFDIKLERDLDPGAGEVDVYPQEITRVLLNLISNGFYATAKRAAQANGAYEPLLAVTTRGLGDRVEIRIRDNGTGIPADIKGKLFTPFFTTKPVGEGTGLGLSLSHDIVVKQHAGTIEVDTEPGEYTEFRILLPRQAASLGGKGDSP